jgi:LPXTG-motif cell wall-anchored protein
MTSSSTSAATFTRKRAFRLGAGAASAGVLGAFSLVGATPAMAATDADCNDANTISIAAGEDAGDIQDALDLGAELICLSGTFVLDTTLLYYDDVTIHGLPGATLDGNNLVGILEYVTPDVGDNPALVVENLRFTRGNSMSGSGGAINADNVTVINSVFDHNVADGNGGAIAAYFASVTNSTFDTNEASNGGAIQTYSAAVVYGSTFSHNEADSSGGAISSYGFGDDTGFVDITNSTFFENSSPEGDGGAIVARAGSIVQSTFLGNFVGPYNGQAVFFYGGSDGEEDTDLLELRGNIFAGTNNLYAHLLDDGDGGIISDLGGNVFSTSAALENDFTASTSTKFEKSPTALFGPNTLANNGGLTQTVALVGSSPAINAVPVGEPSVAVDQRGTARDALSDSGAYEYVPALADTGSTPNGWLAGIAGGLLAAGAAALVVTRRRFSNR